MSNVIFILALLACPLGMLAMAGMAWVVGKTAWGRSSRLGQAAAHAGCMHGHGHSSGGPSQELDKSEEPSR